LSDSTLRLFAAIPLPDSCKQAVSDWCASLRTELPFGKWVHRDDFHITLQFLGSTPRRKVEEINQALQSASTAAVPFELSIGPLGTFGRPGSPSILWAGIGGDTGPLVNLQKRIAQALSPLGFEPDDRPYRPHLTLARNYIGQEALAPGTLVEYGAPISGDGRPLHWKAVEAVLYTSNPNRRPPQPMYEPAAVFPFGNRAVALN
jgi:2'-5' RNA ligase